MARAPVWCTALLAAVLARAAAFPPLLPLYPIPTPEPSSLTSPYLLAVDRGLSPALGVESARPTFAWAVPPSVPQQASARVVVKSSSPHPSAVFWDSGWVDTASPTLTYAGPALPAGARFEWTVQSAGPNNATLSAVSSPATFSVGLLGAPSSGTTVPVWAPAVAGSAGAAANQSAMYVLLRAEVPLADTTTPVVSALLYATASPQIAVAQAEVENTKLLGAYKVWVNSVVSGMGPGKASRCGPLCPVQHAAGNCTCAPEQLYDVRDVTAAVAAGGATTVTVAVAAFNYPPVPLLPTDSRVLLELHITFASGIVQVVGTEAGGPWRALDATAYMRPQGNFGFGAWYVSPRENFDARLEPVGWRESGFDASAWPAPAAVEAFASPLVARPTKAVAVLDDPAVVAPPRQVLFYPDHVFVDFGVDFTGGVCLDVSAGVAGVDILVSLAEEVEYVGEGANLTLYARPMRTDNNYTQVWTLRDGAQTICMHEWAQFRYVQIEVVEWGLGVGRVDAVSGGGARSLGGTSPSSSPPSPPSAYGLTPRAWVVFLPSAYLPSDTFSFTSNGLPPNGGPPGSGGDDDAAALAAVWELSWFTRASQGLDMYFDHVRQRDVYCVEELTIDLLQQYAVSTEWQVQPFTLAYVLNNRPESLGWAEWPPLALFSVHEIFLHTGDLDLFAAHYDQLRTFSLLAAVNASATGLWTCTDPPTMDCTNAEVDWPPSSRDGFVFTPTNTVVNAIVYRALTMFSDMAAALGGRDADVALFAATAASLRAAINARLWADGAGPGGSGGGYVDGLNTTHRAWHSSAFALGMGVPDDSRVPDAVAAVVARLPAGNASVTEACFPSNVWPTQWALEGLYGAAAADDHGRLGLAVITCPHPQGWVAMRALNFTQAPEAWNDAVKGNQELGMTWGAAPADVIPRLVLGVLPLAPGFASVQVRPQPGLLGGVRGAVPTARGYVGVDYVQTVAGTAVVEAALALTLPGAMNATVCLPLHACGAGGVVGLDGAGVQGTVQGDYACVSGLFARADGAARRLQCPAA
jgi:hypothetical protein